MFLNQRIIVMYKWNKVVFFFLFQSCVFFFTPKIYRSKDFMNAKKNVKNKNRLREEVTTNKVKLGLN